MLPSPPRRRSVGLPGVRRPARGPRGASVGRGHVDRARGRRRAAASFDAVSCRIAAHHSPAPTAFVDEVARVLEPGVTLAFEDNVSPADDDLDAFLNDVERLRDPTHVRSHAVADWIEWLEGAGFTVETASVASKRIAFGEWAANVDASAERRERIAAAFEAAPPGAAERFEFAREGGRIESFANLKLLVKATR
ncbi:hypothetical protein DJ82_00850 [Halorubrum sp. Ib24]|nr:hypothetical protein DJ82_00850 [Halorubrum sp. Ib24]